MRAIKMTANTIRLIKATLHELASQLFILATGLQNAAPPGALPTSVQYLLEIAAHLEHISNNVETLLIDDLSTKE